MRAPVADLEVSATPVRDHEIVTARIARSEHVEIGRQRGHDLDSPPLSRSAVVLCVAESLAGLVVDRVSDRHGRDEEGEQDGAGEGDWEVHGPEGDRDVLVDDCLDEPDDEAVEEVAERDRDQPACGGEGDCFGGEDATDVAGAGADRAEARPTRNVTSEDARTARTGRTTSSGEITPTAAWNISGGNAEQL